VSSQDPDGGPGGGTAASSSTATGGDAVAAAPNVFNSWVGGGDDPGDCYSNWAHQPPESPYIGDGNAERSLLTLGDDKQICLAGFELHAAIEVTINRPDGSAQQVTVTGGGGTEVGPTELLAGDVPGIMVFADHGDYLATDMRQLEPDLPQGEYVLTADQAGLHAEVLLEATHGVLGDPDLARLKPQYSYDDSLSVVVGDRLDVLLLRFEPNADVPLFLYRNTGRFRHHGEGSQEGDGVDFEFVEQLTSVRVNADGWARSGITVPFGLTATTSEFGPDYCIVTLPELMTPYCQPATTFSFDLSP
jgi:hypothetical protein